MNQAALCPTCQREVVFDTTGEASVCPACGARFELAFENTPQARTRSGQAHGTIFVAWMFAPAVVALLTMMVLPVKPNAQFGQQFTDYPNVFMVLLVLSAISCYAACSWLMGRFTRKRWLCILVGLLLGATILLCNVLIAFFGSCAITGGLRS